MICFLEGEWGEGFGVRGECGGGAREDMEQGEKRREDRYRSTGNTGNTGKYWWVLIVESEQLASAEQLYVCECSVHRTRRALTCCSEWADPVWKSTTSMAAKAQQLPHLPWFLMGGIFIRQSASPARCPRNGVRGVEDDEDEDEELAAAVGPPSKARISSLLCAARGPTRRKKPRRPASSLLNETIVSRFAQKMSRRCATEVLLVVVVGGVADSSRCHSCPAGVVRKEGHSVEQSPYCGITSSAALAPTRDRRRNRDIVLTVPTNNHSSVSPFFVVRFRSG